MSLLASPPILRQEQLLRQGDTTVEDFFDQFSVVWYQLDILGP
jgi:hypothetical protein